MGIFDWVTRRARRAHPLDNWRSQWGEALGAPDRATLERLRDSLAAQADSIEDHELEDEMLDAYARLVDLTDELRRGVLPIVETTHRVVGADRCHFTAPASMPEDPGQPSGRLLLTNARLLFVGGPSLTTLPWHAASDILNAGRDLVVVRNDRESLHRFRCNTYGDAVCSAALARHLAALRRARV